MLMGIFVLRVWLVFFIMPLNMIYIVEKFQTSSYNTFRVMNFFLVNLKRKSTFWWENFFLECSWYFSWMRLYMFYIVAKFWAPTYNTFWDMIFFLVWFLVKWQTDRRKAMHMSPPCICTGGLKNSLTLLQIINGWPLLIWMSNLGFYDHESYLLRATRYNQPFDSHDQLLVG